MSVKCRQFQNNSYVFDVTPNNFRYADQRPDCSILCAYHTIRSRKEKSWNGLWYGCRYSLVMQSSLYTWLNKIKKTSFYAFDRSVIFSQLFSLLTFMFQPKTTACVSLVLAIGPV